MLRSTMNAIYHVPNVMCVILEVAINVLVLHVMRDVLCEWYCFEFAQFACYMVNFLILIIFCIQNYITYSKYVLSL